MSSNKCDLCGKDIYPNRMSKHINICQSPNVHVFCGKDCKKQWVRDEYNKKSIVENIENATA